MLPICASLFSDLTGVSFLFLSFVLLTFRCSDGYVPDKKEDSDDDDEELSCAEEDDTLDGIDPDDLFDEDDEVHLVMQFLTQLCMRT